MLFLKSLLLLPLLGFWRVNAGGCGDLQAEINGRCCDMCPPGEHVEVFCTRDRPTVCRPCGNGSFSNNYTVFDRCEKCQTCQQEYEEKCTATTDAKCLCDFGFLCSDNQCSSCEENKCVPGEKLKRREVTNGTVVTQYLYQCEPACPDHTYYDDQDQTCRPRTQCSALGLDELFSGNKSHNSVCDIQGLKNGNLVPMILGLSFAVFSVCFLVPFLLAVAYRRNLWRRKSNYLAELMVRHDVTNFHLSKEESGHQLVLQDETKDDNNPAQLHLGTDAGV
ncbi:tumor necrosis factor receptor superfamily member 18 [Cynoglossus semilaevis]|uniref:tumor necrosis factor receptor superfamily member 18 n=1 Tax=Cynoglossus semilaevis TaxID=244447 RepID=UPI0007DC9A77|nr:tumor necrosis factor receptor superfamily member 5 [Cynoglossus semilaevis]